MLEHGLMMYTLGLSLETKGVGIKGWYIFSVKEMKAVFAQSVIF